IRGNLNGSRCDINTGTEGGVLLAVTGLSQPPPSGGTSCHRSGGIINVRAKEAKSRFHYPAASHPCTRGVLLWDFPDDESNNKPYHTFLLLASLVGMSEI
ncbi:hypothetical protein AVEN_80542-1, partial [Araneus ventricosus]